MNKEQLKRYLEWLQAQIKRQEENIADDEMDDREPSQYVSGLRDAYRSAMIKASAIADEESSIARLGV